MPDVLSNFHFSFVCNVLWRNSQHSVVLSAMFYGALFFWKPSLKKIVNALYHAFDRVIFLVTSKTPKKMTFIFISL